MLTLTQICSGLLAIVGFGFLVTKSKIFKTFREKVSAKKIAWASTLVNCPSCFSTWIGAIYGLNFLDKIHIFAMGAYLVAYVIDNFVEYLKRN